ncbi:bifunctional lysylphosphatidylglycerol synthetase/lysine--tRNA ligase LysX [Nocardioides zeae]|uniref:Lysine--tRNA ligase n=1 Tax=Nocardioides zeae TaxID=1457234 RepID=A0A6P0HDD1_9ACTN|nr:bifunctional lysylphosphatidylglycerol synthetase/lysine--tRNA ligase LysX [Nocardioides zeae]
MSRTGELTATPEDVWPGRYASATWVLATVVLVVTVVKPWHQYFLQTVDPISLATIAIVPSFVYASLLAVLAVALRRRLRAAWWLLVLWWLVVPQVDRILLLASGESVGPAAAGLVLSSLLLVGALRTRRYFVARRVPGSLPLAAAILGTGAVLCAVVGAHLVERFGRAESSPAALEYVVGRLLLDIGSVPLGTDATAPWWVRATIGVLGSIAVLGAAIALFRAPADHRVLDVEDEARVRHLLREHGEEDSLGYFATRRDKSVVWDADAAADARAGVSYRVIGGVSLASGNPVGDPRRWPEAVRRWLAEARLHGWTPAVMGAGTTGAQTYAAAGLKMIDLGDEAILDLTSFTLTGPSMRSVRQSVSRLQRRGYVVQVARHGDLEPGLLAELRAAAGRWRGDGGSERGFSMALGRLEDPLDEHCVLLTARDGDGRVRGFLSLVPWGRAGVSLDLMRRDPSADNGIVELMVATLAEQARGLGVREVSLNFAMFREAFERGAEMGAGPVLLLWHRILVIASRTWQLESLYRSNAKYHPAWRPRFLGFEMVSDLPRVGTAVGRAEGFLEAPSPRRLLARLTGAAPDDALDSGTEAHAAAVRALMPAPCDPLAEALDVARLPEQVRVRRAKLDRLVAAGVDPYPVAVPSTHTLAEVRAAHAGIPRGARTGCRVSVTGRVLLRRDHGGLGFLTLHAGGAELQAMVETGRLDPTSALVWDLLDLADHVAVTGEVVRTDAGELSVAATRLVLASKALRPLPDKHRGLTDPEARVRQRYVDLVVRPDARTAAYQRATVVRSVRDSLHARGFTEVETPVLQTVHGGANARPFTTHINAYDLDLSLRIATELHLKRLVVGGMEQVFEIGRQFRNEGADATHNPEFTSLEVYQAYADHDAMRRLTQELVREAAVAVHGEPVLRARDAAGRVVEHDVAGDWPVVPICTAVSQALGEEVDVDTPVEVLLRHAERHGLDPDGPRVWGVLVEELYGKLCERVTTAPVFYTEFPAAGAPLARAHRRDPRLAEKWDLVVNGAEQATAYSELTDPVLQRRRLLEQSLLAASGDPEAMVVDEDFLRALEHGMPPTGGMGLGIDRLVMNIVGGSIRDTILFPLVKP